MATFQLSGGCGSECGALRQRRAGELELQFYDMAYVTSQICTSI